VITASKETKPLGARSTKNLEWSRTVQGTVSTIKLRPDAENVVVKPTASMANAKKFVKSVGEKSMYTW